jgi:gluconokinase
MKMPSKDICQAVIVMGVSGCGKSTFGMFLQRELGYTFTDGDDLHPPINVAKMSRGMPLDDDDRAPWLEAICAHVGEKLESGTPVVVACSALKKRYRDKLRSASDRLRFVHLIASQEAISKRVSQREGHYMPPDLLPSQFAALESTTEEVDVVEVNVEGHLLNVERAVLDAVKPAKT